MTSLVDKILRLIGIVLLILAPFAAHGVNTATVTVNLADVFNGGLQANAQVCFSLKNYSGNVPRVVGTNVILQDLSSPWCKSPDVNGLVSTTLVGNDVIVPNTCTPISACTYYAVEYWLNGQYQFGGNYQFTSNNSYDLASATPINTAPVVTSPTGDTTYARLDGGNQPFLGAISAPKVNGFYYVGGTTYPTVQSAITAACGASPAGGTVYIPSGTYAFATTPITTCAGLTLIGEGRNTADNVTCPTTLTSTVTGTTAFIASVNQDHLNIRDLCVKNVGAGGGVAVQLNGGRFSDFDRLYISGPWATGIDLETSSTSGRSTIWNEFRDIHITGLQSTGIGCLLNSNDSINKTINNNTFWNVGCTGGSAGVGIKVSNTNALQNINENVLYAGEESTSTGVSGGTGILFAATATRGMLFLGVNVEANHLGLNKATGNTVTFVGGNFSSNDTNVTDSQPAFSQFIGTNVGGTVQNFYVTPAGNVGANAFCIGSATCDPGNLNGTNGWALEGGGTVAATVNTTGLATARAFTSTLATGTAPFTITSTTPVTNLAATPTTYNAAGTQQTNSHLVVDTCVLGTNCGVTLVGAAAFAGSNSYQCVCTDLTAANACAIAQASGSSVTLTGTGTDHIRYICAGN